MSKKLTPETEECYERVPASFPGDWFDGNASELRLKKEAPKRAHQEFKKWNDYRGKMLEKGILVD